MTVWHLKREAEKKFRSGHPWVFSNELAQSPKGIEPGTPIELRDHKSAFLARGYGHPNSLISFRVLSTRESDAMGPEFFHMRLKEAARLRKVSGLQSFSHRLCFAEGDRLPGLVIDRYRLHEGGQVFVVQSSTAGMDRELEAVFAALEKLSREEHHENKDNPDWENSSIILANDSKARAMEGVAIEPKKIVRAAAGFEGEKAKLIVQPGLKGIAPLVFNADLIGGQKTGFFLDQRLNIQLASGLALEIARERGKLRVLDLCCYIGQWGSQLAHMATSLGIKAEVVCVDASASALALAVRNVEAHGGVARAEKMDVLTALERIEQRSFDVVICDPPAFIKKKKDLPTGSQAYYKMNREAIRRAAPGSLYVSCSCSGLFTEEDFRAMLARVSTSIGGEVSWLARGGHSPDHPQRPEFPQGTYLKSWLGLVR